MRLFYLKPIVLNLIGGNTSLIFNGIIAVWKAYLSAWKQIICENWIFGSWIDLNAHNY